MGNNQKRTPPPNQTAHVAMSSKPSAPVMLSDAVCDKNGILVKWIVANNVQIDTHTLSWKAESWWQSSSTTLPPTLDEFQITNIPPNEKVRVWIHSTNAAGSSPYSNEVSFVSSRDCMVKGELEPDFMSEEIPLSKELVMKCIYTKEFQDFQNTVGSGVIGKLEVLSEGDNTIVTKLTPPIDPKARSAISAVLGDFDLYYEEHAIKKMEETTVTFTIKNFSAFQDYVETAEGEIKVEGDEKSCKISSNFDFRLKNVPVVGYYISQLVKQSFVDGSSRLKENLMKYQEQ